jgi:hypothetical protein
MDSFDMMLQELNSKDEAERARMIDGLKGECICPDCPTYNRCASETKETLFCLLGRSSDCIKDEMGCICPDCPVAARADLVNLYYCTSGSETEMRKK